VMHILQKAGVAAAPCLDLMERFSDPHYSERGTHLQVEHPATGVDIVAGIPFKLSGMPDEVRQHAPLLGEHNDYVFRELLGKPEAEIAQLVEEKVIF
jgi:crotonobetainyl-CoA:carnitine CoA-transferase CaiB-like acyl-CoA transferase